jgi:hypothetical protein
MTTFIETPLMALAAANARTSSRHSKRWERIVIWASTGSIAVMLIAFMMTKFSSSAFWQWTILVAGGICMLLGSLLASGNALLLAAPLTRLVANPTGFLLSELDGNLRRERDEIAQLAKRFDRDQLDHTHERLSLAVTQLRHRISLTVGAVEKLGLVPGAVVGAYYLLQLVREENIQSTHLPLVFASVAVVYVLAGRQLFVVLRLEQLALIAKRAADAVRTMSTKQM